MIFSLLTKYWRTIFDALVIVAIITLVFLINPFDIFGSGLKLNDTANMVSNVRSIGQLVTAEYYGEVISSLDESKLYIIEKDKLNKKAQDYYRKLKKEVSNLYIESIVSTYGEQDFRKRTRSVRNELNDAREEFSQKYEKIKKGSLEDYVIMFWAIKLRDERIDFEDYNDDRDDIIEEQLENLFDYVLTNYRIYVANQEDFNEFLNQGFEKNISFSKFYNNFSKNIKNEKDKELALIGRGSVKAGFDFGKLDERRFNYDRETKTVHLFGITSKILDVNINPWFIPEKRIPGFDIIVAEDVNFEDAKRVKKHCVSKLETNAINAGIIDRAREYGEEAIKEFFSLLTNDEIKAVKFHADELNVVYEKVAKDSLISFDEINLIDSTYKNYLQSINKLKGNTGLKKHKNFLLSRFIQDLKKFDIEVYSNSKKDAYRKTDFNFFTKELQNILQDTVITIKELNEITHSLRWVIESDTTFIPENYKTFSHWFDDSLSFVNEFNLFIEKLDEFKYDTLAFNFISESDTIQNNTQAFKNKITSLNSEKGKEKGKVYNYIITGDIVTINRIDSTKNFDLDSLKYNINTDSSFIAEIVKKDSLDVKEINLTAIDSLVNTNRQIDELNSYSYYLEKLNEKYHRDWILRASENVKKNILSKENFSNFRDNIANRFKNIF